MRKEKEINGKTREKSPNLKNGFPDSGPDSDSKKAASEENNSELEQEMTVEQLKEVVFPHPTVSEILKETLFTVK